MNEGARLNAAGAAVYVTLNPINPQILGRCCNRVQDYAKATVTDKDAVRRCWLLIDFDPVRPTDTSATDAQVAAARERARACYLALKAEGWPQPQVGGSGNGYHLLYLLDLPNDAESTALVKGALAGLAARFDTEAVKVDQTVFNAGRITKLYGTVATKGDHTLLTPWRLSRLVSRTDRDVAVTADQLRALHPKGNGADPNIGSAGEPGEFDLPAFLSRLGIPYEQDVHEGADRYKLEHCPFIPEHGRGEAAILRQPGGRLGFKCQHESCRDKHWQDVRALVDGPREARAPTAGARAPGGSEPHGGEEWSDSQPIQAPLHPVPAFDPKTLLPEALGGWIMDEADRMPCPPDFIAAAALVELGAIIGARCAIKPKAKDDWLVVPNIWGGSVGPPAAKKSPAIGKAMKPLARLIAQAMEAHRAAIGNFEAGKVAFEAKKEAIEERIKAAAKDAKKGNVDDIVKELEALRQEAPKEPNPRRYKTNDTTVEKLGELLLENPHGLLVLRDELVGLVASWEKEGREGDRAFFLEAWSGDASFDTDRIRRGSVSIPNLCVSIFGGIQPDKLTAYLEQAEHALANDGMLQRFQLLVYPDHCPWEWRDRLPAKDARDRAFAVFDVLSNFDPVTWGTAPANDFAKFPHFRFNETAQEVFIEWSGDLHRTRLPAEEHPIVAQHLAKYDKLFPSLALILHLVECAATGQRGQVTKQAALRAAAWCEYLEAHARRCYGLLADDGLRAAQALADKVMQGRLPDGFTARDVRRNQWRYMTVDEAIQAALDWLEDEGWLRAEKAGTGAQGGRPTRSYRINPKVVRSGKPGGAA